MPRRAKLRPDEPGREKIMEAARELFGAAGYDATSIADIGERAGIAKSVLYHYFGSKAGLYRAILESQNGALLQRVSAAVPGGGTDRLRAGIDAYLGFLEANPDAWRLLLRDPPSDSKLRKFHDELAAERSEALATLLAEPAKLAGKRRHVELVATAIRAFAAWWYEHRDVSREEITEAILDVAAAGAERLAQGSRAAVS